MIKRVGIFGIAKDKDPDEVWRFYSEVHAPEIAGIMPGLKKYVINRAIEPWIDPKNKPRWWGILEQWVEREEAFDQTASTPPPESHQKDMKIWASYTGERIGGGIVEERVIFEDPTVEARCKRLDVFSLGEGQDPEEAWRYWQEINAVDWKSKMPGCRLYAVSRLIKPMHDIPKWWGMLEQRFGSREACEQAANVFHPVNEFMARFGDEVIGTAYAEEKVIV
jgi:hypothetical protein